MVLAAALALAFGGWFITAAMQQPELEEPIAAKKVAVVPIVGADARAQSQLAPPSLDLAKARAALLAKLADAAEYQGFINGLRIDFPDVYEKSLELAAAENLGAQKNGADLYLTKAVMLLRESFGVEAARAGAQAMQRVFDSQLDVMRHLERSDVSLCVDYLNGGSNGNFVAFTGANRTLMGEAAHLGLLAILDGKEKKIAREPPTDEDFSALELALRAAGLSSNAVGALLDGKKPDPPIPDAEMCKAGIAYFEALKALPESTRSRLYALALDVMARS